MITKDQYETFRDNINTLIQEYREIFSMLVNPDSKEYEETYRKRLLGMSLELRSMIDHVSGIVVDEFNQGDHLQGPGSPNRSAEKERRDGGNLFNTGNGGKWSYIFQNPKEQWEK